MMNFLEEIKTEAEVCPDKCLSPPPPLFLGTDPDLDDFAVKLEPGSGSEASEDEGTDSLKVETEDGFERESEEEWKDRAVGGTVRNRIYNRKSAPKKRKRRGRTNVECLFCTKKSSKPWPASDQLSGNWPEIFGFEFDLECQNYCSSCQQLLRSFSQLCKELEEIQARISDVKGRIESRILNSGIRGRFAQDCGEDAGNRRKSMRSFRKKEVNSESVKRILSERLNLATVTCQSHKHRDRDALKSSGNNCGVRTPIVVLQRMTTEEVNEDAYSDDESTGLPSPSSEHSWQGADPLSSSEGQRSSRSDSDSDFEITKRKKRSKVLSKKGQNKGLNPSEAKLKRTVGSPTAAGIKERVKKVKRGKAKQSGGVEKTVRCDRCARMFFDEIRKEAHIKRFHEGLSKGFTCDQPDCTKDFKSFMELESHKLSHTGETPFYCEVCGKGFKLQAHLNAHQKKIHLTEAQRFKCDQCDKAYAFNCDLKVHKKSHSTIEYAYTCEICGVTYARVQTLNVHMKARHSGKNPFSCKVSDCGKEFSSKLALTDHEYSHTKDWPFFCSECGVGASTKSRLDLHTRRKHGAGFECEICHKRLTYKTSLQVHMLQHKERQFECEECGKKCYDKYTLETHKSIHGGGDKIFPCEFCDKTYFNKPYLRKHMKSNHKPEYYQRMEERLSRSRHVNFVDRGGGTSDNPPASTTTKKCSTFNPQDETKAEGGLKISRGKSRRPQRQTAEAEHPLNPSVSHHPPVHPSAVPPLLSILNSSYEVGPQQQIPSMYNSYPDTNASLPPIFFNFQNL